MNRRNFLKVIATTIFSSSFINASVFNIFEHKKYDITFSVIYPKAFWKKSYFNLVILAATIVAAGAFSYFTAGAGAPEAAAGVSTVASWIGGGGAGSYMAGLSTVGSIFGGNAIVGAAILNGISIGTIGWGAGKVTLSLASKVAVAVDIVISGFVLVNDLNTYKKIYVFDIAIPDDIGSDNIKDLINKIHEINDKKQEALKNKEYKKAQTLEKNLNNYYLLGKKMLEKKLSQVGNDNNLYDLIVLGIIAYKSGEIELYYKSLNTIESFKDKIDKRSFLDYLWGIYFLSKLDGNIEKAFKYFQISYYRENYVIEPVLIILDILSQNYNKQKNLIDAWIENASKNYDDDEYDGKGLLNLYYKAATISFINKDWNKAVNYYKKTYDELGIIGKFLSQTNPIKKQIKMNIAIWYKHLSNNKKATEYLEEALEYCKDNKAKEQVFRIYNES